MEVDKKYCMSSYLTMRYVENADKQFAPGLHHQTYKQHGIDTKMFIATAHDADVAIENVFRLVRSEKLGILLSGGMDSAVLASYMPEGSDAYTFRFLGGKFHGEELERAEKYASHYKLNLHYIDINWDIVEESIDVVMKHKGAPVHSIEPQIYYAAQCAKKDGVTMMVIGDGADYVFGGMDGLLSKDWGFEEYYRRSIYVDPEEVLEESYDMHYLFERYRLGKNSIDYIRFYNEIVTDESYASYENAFETAEMSFIDPYEYLHLSVPLDLGRIRNGESKYTVRELFKMKYPELPVPQKQPMPRPVDEYFKNWEGPKRPEFKRNLDMSKYTGNQKWLLYCLERFLNNLEK
jgi:asparagine synthetase B (glutamine-hydrolysing)